MPAFEPEATCCSSFFGRSENCGVGAVGAETAAPVGNDVCVDAPSEAGVLPPTVVGGPMEPLGGANTVVCLEPCKLWPALMLPCACMAGE